jgi:tRNA threonylcarbamoyladenosine biosynthesis protein TsaB
MLAAAFETSTRRPTVALSAGGVCFEEALRGERPHASDLLPTLERLLSRAGARVRDLELVVVGTGPGSFTGLRVAAATAMGLARGGRAQLFGVPSFEALAWRELALGEQGALLFDARQGELYFGRFRRAAEDVEVLQAACLIRPAELLAAGAGERWFGDADTARAAGLDESARARLCIDRVPQASAVLELGLARFARQGAHAPAQIEPLSLRAFGARKTGDTPAASPTNSPPRG